MGCFQNQMLRIVQHGSLHLCRSSPEHKYHRSVLLIEHTDSRIGEFFPAFAMVGICHVRPHCKHRIEHQDTLLGPFYKITIVRDIASQIIVKFLINIHQRRGNLYIRFHREAQSMSLSHIMIGILTQNHYLHFV